MGASMFRTWPAGLPADLDVCAIQPPGRENRLREAPFQSITDIVEGLLPALLPELDRPFALFGHSMGAVVACEVARALEAQGAPLPLQLIVSARRPPHLPGVETPISGLPDAQFLAEVQSRYGGIPAELLAEPEILALLLPGLRADFTALETHKPPPRSPLPFSITALGGSEDRLTPHHHLHAWGGETLAGFDVRLFSGDHFYLNPRRSEVLSAISELLAPLGIDSRRTA
jgi:medium-chain acyl-[acyl-carrier-protein] hydrolase